MRGSPANAGGLPGRLRVPERQGHVTVRHAERRRRPQERHDVRDRSGAICRPAPADQSPLSIGPGWRGDHRRVVQSVPRPNGVALSPDQKILYVGFERPPAGIKPYVEKYFLKDDGTLAEHSHFAELDIDTSPDGVEVDRAGNVYVANTAGVTVFKSDGTKIGTVKIPEQPTGLAFGGTDLKTLYVTTAGSKIYSVKVNVTGINQ